MTIHQYDDNWMYADIDIRTGDNLGDWEHLAGETAMLLSNNIAGMSFCGGTCLCSATLIYPY